jgi:hypothetical protein
MTNDPLLQRLSGLAWPRPSMDHPDPSAGQLWRAEWRDIVCLVVVLAGPVGREVAVAAAIAEEVGDEASLPATTESGLIPVVWCAVAKSIKVVTLEHRLADLTADGRDAVQQAVAGRSPHRWARISSPLDDRAVVRAELTDALEQLAAAEWAPQADGGSLAHQAEAAGVGVSEVRRRLGIAPGDARNLLQGGRSPRLEELAPLTELLGAPPEGGVSYDPELVHDLELPRFRARLEQRAAATGETDPVALRRAFAEELLPMAARMRGQARRDWKAIIAEVLSAD